MTGLHISRGAWSVRGGVLPVRHVRSVLGAVAGAVVQLSVRPTHVCRTPHHYGDRLHAHLRHHRQKVA